MNRRRMSESKIAPRTIHHGTAWMAEAARASGRGRPCGGAPLISGFFRGSWGLAPTISLSVSAAAAAVTARRGTTGRLFPDRTTIAVREAADAAGSGNSCLFIGIKSKARVPAMF
jgi:hypothetical protein